jgi:hypothetical protein
VLAAIGIEVVLVLNKRVKSGSPFLGYRNRLSNQAIIIGLLF